VHVGKPVRATPSQGSGRPMAGDRHSVSRALIELRKLLGETQQQFASRLGTAITTIARYETSRPPRGRVLARLEQIARSEGHTNCARTFRSALERELGVRAPTKRVARKGRKEMLENPITIYPRDRVLEACDKQVAEINLRGDAVVEIRMEFETDKGRIDTVYIVPPEYQSITKKGKSIRRRVPRMLGPSFQIHG